MRLEEGFIVDPVRTAVIGCGNISSIYLENAAKWDILDLRMTTKES